jgi:hypothetical protein
LTKLQAFVFEFGVQDTNMSAKKRLVAACGGTSSGAFAVSSAGTSACKKRQSMQVSVVVRVRPLLARERQQSPAVVVTPGETRALPSTLTLTTPDSNAEAVQFQLDKCYDERTPQRVLFEKEVAPAVAGVVTGINTTVFAYGATGTGKTFTMEGSKKNLGVVPRCVKRLFETAGESKCEVQVELSYLEIYNDRVQDLLSPASHQADLPIRQQPNGAIVIQGLTKRRIASLTEFELLYEKGSAARKKAITELNPESSRSHSILMVHVQSVDPASGETRSGKLHLIDLAGSEDNRRTGNSGARLAESGKINMSLFVLGKVLMALNAGESKRIPFRDSKLTRLLQDSLGGSSHAVMICNVAPTMNMHADTLQTLNYALKAKGIVNKVTINRSVPPPPPPSVPSTTPTKRVSLSPASSHRTSEQTAKTAREEKLLQWKLEKANARTASLEQRDAVSIGGVKRRSLTVGNLRDQAHTGQPSSSSAFNKRPRLSTALSPVLMTANRVPQSSSTGKAASAPLTLADGKENTPEPTRYALPFTLVLCSGLFDSRCSRPGTCTTTPTPPGWPRS